MKIIAKPTNLIQAQWMMAILEQQGIAAVLLGQSLLGAIGELPADGLLRIAVDQLHQENATLICQDLIELDAQQITALGKLNYGTN
jgi:Putative prokaryotic signal transducing protein